MDHPLFLSIEAASMWAMFLQGSFRLLLVLSVGCISLAALSYFAKRWWP